MSLSSYDKNKLHTIMDLGRNLQEYRLAHLASLRQSDCGDIKVSVNLKFWDSYINNCNTMTVIITDKELINKICEYIDNKYETLSEEIHKQLNPQEENNS